MLPNVFVSPGSPVMFRLRQGESLAAIVPLEPLFKAVLFSPSPGDIVTGL